MSDELIDALKTLTTDAPDFITCPCGERVRSLVVKKDGPNKGRPFAACDKCNRFQWLDLPLCRCGERKYKATCKSGRHAGRPFMACPNRCQGSFSWLRS